MLGWEPGCHESVLPFSSYLTDARISVRFLTAVWAKASYLLSLRDNLQRMCEDALGAFVSQRTGRLRPGLKPGNRDSSRSAASHCLLCSHVAPNLCREGEALMHYQGI